MNYLVYKDHEAMSQAAAKFVVKKVNEKPDLVVCFPTGGTPVRMYELLAEANARKEVDFSKARVLSVDGYANMPPNHEKNFSYFLHKNLFDKCNFTPSNIDLMRSDAADLSTECQRYNQLIEKYGGIDLLIDGVGENGHAAYNEPADYVQIGVHVEAISEWTARVNARFFEKIEDVPTHGITLGIDSYVNARTLLVLASGEKKTTAIERLISDNKVTPQFPVTFLKLSKNAYLMVDEAAAGYTKEGKNVSERKIKL